MVRGDRVRVEEGPEGRRGLTATERGGKDVKGAERGPDSTAHRELPKQVKVQVYHEDADSF